jgi:hypothetical protein
LTTLYRLGTTYKTSNNKYNSIITHIHSSIQFKLQLQLQHSTPFPLPQEHRSDSQSNSHTHNSSLDTKNQSEPIALDPRRLEVSHREPATGAPHIQNGRDTGRLLRVFLQRVSRDGTVQMMLEIRHNIQVSKAGTYTIVATIPIFTMIHPMAIPIQCFPKCMVNP